MLFLIPLLSLSLAKGENCHILENLEYPLLSKDGEVIIGAIFSIHSGTQMQLLTYTEKPQPLTCIRFVEVEISYLYYIYITLLQIVFRNLYCIAALNFLKYGYKYIFLCIYINF